MKDLLDSEMTDPDTGLSYPYVEVLDSAYRLHGCAVEERVYTIDGNTYKFQVTLYDVVGEGKQRVTFTPMGSPAPDAPAAAAPAPQQAAPAATTREYKSAAIVRTDAQQQRVDVGETLTVELNGTRYALTPEFGAPKPEGEGLLKDFAAIGVEYLNHFGHVMPPPDKTDEQKERCANDTVEMIAVAGENHAVSPTHGLPVPRTLGALARKGLRVWLRIVKPGKTPRAAWGPAVADSGKLGLEMMNETYVVYDGVGQRDVTEADMRMLQSMGARRAEEQKLYAEAAEKYLRLYGHTMPPPATTAHLRGLFWMFDTGEVFVAHKVAAGAEPVWWSYTEPQRVARERKAKNETAADEQKAPAAEAADMMAIDLAEAPQAGGASAAAADMMAIGPDPQTQVQARAEPDMQIQIVNETTETIVETIVNKLDVTINVTTQVEKMEAKASKESAAATAKANRKTGARRAFEYRGYLLSNPSGGSDEVKEIGKWPCDAAGMARLVKAGQSLGMQVVGQGDNLLSNEMSRYDIDAFKRAGRDAMRPVVLDLVKPHVQKFKMLTNARASWSPKQKECLKAIFDSQDVKFDELAAKACELLAEWVKSVMEPKDGTIDEWQAKEGDAAEIELLGLVTFVDSLRDIVKGVATGQKAVKYVYDWDEDGDALERQIPLNRRLRPEEAIKKAVTTMAFQLAEHGCAWDRQHHGLCTKREAAAILLAAYRLRNKLAVTLPANIPSPAAKAYILEAVDPQGWWDALDSTGKSAIALAGNDAERVVAATQSAGEMYPQRNVTPGWARLALATETIKAKIDELMTAEIRRIEAENTAAAVAKFEAESAAAAQRQADEAANRPKRKRKKRTTFAQEQGDLDEAEAAARKVKRAKQQAAKQQAAKDGKGE